MMPEVSVASIDGSLRKKVEGNKCSVSSFGTGRWRREKSRRTYLFSSPLGDHSQAQQASTKPPMHGLSAARAQNGREIDDGEQRKKGNESSEDNEYSREP